MVGEREVRVRLRADIDQYQRAMREASLSTTVFGRNTSALRGPLQDVEQQSGRSGKEIDKLSGRLRVMTDAALTLGPALIPLGAAGLPLLAAGAATLGAAAGGIAVAALAFNGLGDALKALDAYQLDKTPENLAKLNQAFADVGPSGAHFVQFLDDLEPKLKDLQNIARNGLLPGVEAGIDDLLTRLPQVKRIVRDLSQGLGQLSADAGESLGGPKFTAFFDYLESDARPTLEEFARSAGNIAEVFANLTVAFAPLTRGFTGGLEGMTRALAEWSRGLDQNDSFQSFLRYIQDSGPQAIAFLGSLAKAFAAIVEAAAPYGQVVLPALTALADVFATIASSDIGGPLVAGAAALVLFNRGQQAFNKVTGTDAVSSLRGLKGALSEVITAQDRARLSAAELQAIEANRSAAISGGLKTIGKGAALYGGLAIAASGAADGIGLTNTASLAMMGLIGGPWGAAVGGGVGLLLDWRNRSDGAKQAAADFTATLDQQTGALTDNTRALAVKKLMDSDALKAAQDLGISLQLVTDAALGNEAAQTQLNAALAQYDEGGAARAGREATNAHAAGLLGSAVEDVSSAVEASRNQFGLQVGAMGTASKATNSLRAAYDQTAQAASDLNDEVQSLDDLLSKRSSFRAYQADLDNFRDALKKAPHDFSALNEAGRTNLGNLDQIIQDASQHLQYLTNPKQKAAFLDQVIQQLRDIGKQSPEAAAAVKDVLPALKEVRDANKSVVIKANNADAMKKAAETSEALHDLATSRARPKIEADDGPARHSINGVKGLMMDLDGTRANPKISADAGAVDAAVNHVTTMLRNLNGDSATVYVHTVRNDIPLPGQSADGGSVPKDGGPYSDRFLYLLAPGEEVISNRRGQADRFRADRAAGRIPGYADGGLVQRPSLGEAGSSRPLFAGEGPRYYKAAYKHNKPFALDGPSHWPWPYQTSLSEALSYAFEDWVFGNKVPFDIRAPIVDYDMRGFWKKTRGRGWKPGSHFPDTWKTPYDTTFSHESMYATKDNPFYWKGDTLVDVRSGQVIFSAADGGTVPGMRASYRDSILALLAPGEEVISNRHGQADRYRARVKGRYADGGTTGGTWHGMGGGHGGGGDPVSVWTDGVYSVAKALKAFKAELEAASKAVDREKQKRNDLIAAEQAFMQSVGGAYSKADLFSGGLSEFDTGLSANINDTQAAQAALSAAASHGLSGPLYQALAASGNLTLLQEFAGLSSDQIGIREQQFASQSNAQAALGTSAANEAGFTQAVKDVTKELKEAQQERKHLAAVVKSLEDKLPKNVEDGARKGIAEREKRTHQRIRTGA